MDVAELQTRKATCHEPASVMIKCNRSHRKKTAYGLVYRSVVVPHDVDAAVTLSKTSVWPSTTDEVVTQLHSMGLFAIGMDVVELHNTVYACSLCLNSRILPG